MLNSFKWSEMFYMLWPLMNLSNLECWPSVYNIIIEYMQFSHGIKAFLSNECLYCLSISAIETAN